MTVVLYSVLQTTAGVESVGPNGLAGMTAVLITNLFSFAPLSFFHSHRENTQSVLWRVNMRKSLNLTHDERYLFSAFGEGENMLFKKSIILAQSYRIFLMGLSERRLVCKLFPKQQFRLDETELQWEQWDVLQAASSTTCWLLFIFSLCKLRCFSQEHMRKQSNLTN